MKDHLIKRTFVVTHYVPCTECKELLSENEVTQRSSYIYGEGWLKRSQCCNPCFEKLKADAKANVKTSGDYESW